MVQAQHDLPIMKECIHPEGKLTFLRYSAETINTPRRYVRHFFCNKCGKYLNDDCTSGFIVEKK